MHVVASVVIGVATGIVASLVVVVLIQVLPSLYRWGDKVGWTREEGSGRDAYHVRFGLRPPQSRPAQMSRRWRKGARGRRLVPRRYGPFDVKIHARVAVRGLTHGDPDIETVVAIPVDMDWRPAVAEGVLTRLRPEYCNPLELRSFPTEIKEKRASQSLSLHDLLAIPGARLRVYAYGSRPYIGTRLVARGSFTHEDIVAGRHKQGRLVPAEDKLPPVIPAAELPPKFLEIDPPPRQNPAEEPTHHSKHRAGGLIPPTAPADGAHRRDEKLDSAGT